MVYLVPVVQVQHLLVTAIFRVVILLITILKTMILQPVRLMILKDIFVIFHVLKLM